MIDNDIPMGYVFTAAVLLLIEMSFLYSGYVLIYKIFFQCYRHIGAVDFQYNAVNAIFRLQRE